MKMMTSPLLIFSSSFSYYTVIVLTIFNHVHYENAIVSADISSSLVFDSNSCLLTEPYYNYTFNLSLSTDLGRHIIGNSPNEQIDFNFCSSFDRKCGDKQNVHACLEKNGKKYVLGTSQKITYNNGRITFIYDGGEPCENGKNYQLSIDLQCDYTIDSQLFGFQNTNDSCFYYLKWEDSRACLPVPEKIHGECKITDKDFTFDFSPLGEFNYRVSDRDNSEFIINPCQPVLYDFNATCPSGSSICYYAGKEELSKRFTSYGTANPNPVMEDNNPVIIYNSDKQCNDTHSMRSKIYFHCDWKNEYGNPKYNHFSECTYHFVWLTSFACRRGEKEDDIPCVLRDPSTAFLYNMTDLANKYYESDFNGKKYSFAICESNDEKNGAYLLNDGKKDSRGRISSILLRHKTGVPYLSYDSDVRCSDSMKWKTEIYFVCPENVSNENKIEILNDTNCNLQINFETKLACQYEVSCNIPQYNIDLTSLINTTGYYIAKINDSFKDTIKSKEFLINVCRPVKNIKSEKCYDGSGACVVSLDSNNKIIDELSLGHPSVLTKTSESEVVLKYYNGSPCTDNPSINFSSSIKFYCDHKMGKGLPILQSIIDKCHYEFNWATNVICPQHSVKFNVDTCEIINDVIDVKFDLKDAKFAGGNGKITAKSNGIDEIIDLCNYKNTKANVDYSHSMVTLFFKLNKKCAGQDSNQMLIQLNLICAPSENRTTLPVVSFLIFWLLI
ncbi:cation-independent mannose-6-phosphate receptor-like [Condylostylus longicornis]|uniref:cation-independent mannose-6-phosphate receptor-like n=1 Tax=Condylostylus longicornis TaxID=2530218 RepID=UPI00244E2FFB|nr:cation-independent mannose-6-phosphate receptor-like [Condylostylus longicornis]